MPKNLSTARLTHSLIATFFLAVIPLVATHAIGQSAAGDIHSISPTAARKGESVTIEGNGFGALNVRITVGGVPAQIVSANGVQVTFIVPDGVRPGLTQVVAINPGFQSGNIGFRMLEGILLPGNSSALAIRSLFNLPPARVDPSVIVDGTVMTRLVLRLKTDATVGELNAALMQVEGGIVSMQPGFGTITIAVPHQATIQDLLAVADLLELAPGIRFASLARVPVPFELPTGTTDSGDLGALLPTRFPAAWNVRKLIEGCPGGPVPVLVADFFSPLPPANFDMQVPNFRLANTALGSDKHGYDVTTTLAAKFDADIPTGANPFSECLDVIGVDLSRFATFSDAAQVIVDKFPAGKFIMNYSVGYNDCFDDHIKECRPFSLLVPDIIAPLDRALDALDWKTLTARRPSSDFLVTTAAGNEADKEEITVYPGPAHVISASPINAAAKADPFFTFVQDASLWSYPPDPATFPSIAATSLQFGLLDDEVVARGMQTTVPNNVVVVGSTTDGGNAEPSFTDLLEAPFSNLDADVKAVGQTVAVLGTPTIENGTSFSAPQVAGLTSYLWLLSPDLRTRPVQTTMQAILQNVRSTGAGAVIDAYATVLSLDPVGALCSSNPCIRLALLDVDGDGAFDEQDLVSFLTHYFVRNQQGDLTNMEVQPSVKDFSRWDLNGDGFTGGPGTERFDLDRVGSTQYGHTDYSSQVTQEIENQDVTYDKSRLKDLDILCYYAYSNLYAGNTDDRKSLLAGRCAGIVVQPAKVTLLPGQKQQFTATVPNGDPVSWSVNGGGTIDPQTGLFAAGNNPGTFTVRATDDDNPALFGLATVTVSNANSVAFLGRFCRTDAFGVSFFSGKTLLEPEKDCSTFPPPPYASPAVSIVNSVSVYNYVANYTEDISPAEVSSGTISGGTLDAVAEVDVPAIDISKVPTNPNGVQTIAEGDVEFSTQSGSGAYLLTISGTITSTNCCNTNTQLLIRFFSFVAPDITIKPFSPGLQCNVDTGTCSFTVTQLMNTVDENGNVLPTQVVLGLFADSGFTTAGVIQNGQSDQARKGEVKLTFTFQKQ